MALISPIAIQDGKTTPATHAFNPVETSPAAKWRENQASLPLVGQGFTVVSVKTQGDLSRVKVSLYLPVLETATGANSQGYTAAPKVAHTNTVNAEFILPSRGTSDQRKDLRVLLSNLLLNSQIVDVIDNVNVPY